jgi:threonine dehydratase
MTVDRGANLVGIEDIRAAHQRIAPYIHRTPILTSSTLNSAFGFQLFFKCENFQKSGAFKVRGAFNALLSLPGEEQARGIVTSSSGNQAAAASLAAREVGVSAHIAMPKIALRSKVAAVERYGGNVVWVESQGQVPTSEEYDATAEAIRERTGASPVHPYDDPRTIAGQATCALELLEDCPRLDLLLAPVGGGGLLSGTALSAAALAPGTRVLGCEPEMADDALQSLRQGKIVPQTDPRTIADGLRTSLGELTFPLIARYVEEIVTVSEEAILFAMRHVWETMKIIIEPSAAVPVAALLEGRIPARASKVGVILSGGNVDLDALPDWPTATH